MTRRGTGGCLDRRCIVLYPSIAELKYPSQNAVLFLRLMCCTDPAISCSRNLLFHNFHRWCLCRLQIVHDPFTLASVYPALKSYNILFVWMRRPLENLQSRQPFIPQSILRQHPSYCLLQHLSTSPLLHHRVHAHLLQRAGSCIMCVVLLLLALLARNMQIMAARCDHVVATISIRGPDRFVLAHQMGSDGGGESS